MGGSPPGSHALSPKKRVGLGGSPPKRVQGGSLAISIDKLFPLVNNPIRTFP